jgi:hypothetical protein
MNNAIVYPFNAILAVVFPSPEYLSSHSLQELIDKDVPPNTPYEVVSQDSLPGQPGFRDAWDANFNDFQGVYINLDKAKVIYKQTADSTAATLSQPLTQEYMRLLAIDGDTSAVKAQLKTINAAAEETAYLDATSVDALIACWPPELGPNPFLPYPSAE